MTQEYTADGRLRAEEVYRRYAPRVFAYLLCHVPTRQDAEDLLVEVFIVVLEKLPSLEVDESRLAAYTQMVARNKVADLYRKRGKRRVVSLETVVETAYEPEGPAPELSVLTSVESEKVTINGKQVMSVTSTGSYGVDSQGNGQGELVSYQSLLNQPGIWTVKMVLKSTKQGTSVTSVPLTGIFTFTVPA